MEIHTITSFETIRDLWEELFAGNILLSPFQDADWTSAILQTYRNNRKLNAYDVCFITDEKNWILPVAIDNDRKEIHLLGRGTCTDYLDIISRSFEKSDLCGLMKYLRECYQGFILCLEQLRENSQLNTALNSDFVAGKELFQTCDCGAIRVRSYDDWYADLSKKHRQNIRTGFNRLKRENMSGEFVWKYVGNMSKKELYDLYEIYGKRRSEKSNGGALLEIKRTLVGKERLFIKDTLNCYCSFGRKENCKAALWYIDGKIAAYFMGVQRGDWFCVPRVSMNSEYARFSPGSMLICGFMKQRPDGIKLLDFTRGDERYKYDNGAVKSKLFYYRLRL